MSFISKSLIFSSQFFLIMIFGYVTYHCCMPVTDVLTQRITRQIIRDIQLFESGERPIDSVTILKGGLSGTRLYKVDVDAASFVVRQIGNRSTYDRQREIAAQKKASAGGWGPHVYYADVSNGIIIMQYVVPDEKKKFLASGNIQQCADLGNLLKKIHAVHSFDYRGSITDQIAHDIQAMSYVKTDTDQSGYFTPGLKEKFLSALARAQHAQKSFPAFSFTHRDLNPNNIIRSGAKLFVIDFENAALDDPYFDLATVGIFNLYTQQDEHVFLSAYFGRAPMPQEYAKYTDMKIAAYLFYGISLIATTPPICINTIECAQPLMDVYEKIDAGIYTLDHPDIRYIFALSLLQQALRF